MSSSAIHAISEAPVIRAPNRIIYEGKPSCCMACGPWCLNTKWLITTRYIERSLGVCCTTIENIPLIKIRDISYASTCCCGIITVFSSDVSSPEIKLIGLPNSKDIYTKMRDAIQEISANARMEVEM